MSQEEIEKLTEAIDELTDRVRELEDIEELKAVQANIIYWLCNRQWDDIVQCFDSSATLNFQDEEMTGREQIDRFLHDRCEPKLIPEAGYVLGQPVIAAHGDKASGYWTLHLFYNNPVRWAQGKIECDFLRDYGIWKIRYWRFTVPWPERA
ncbi:MAG: SnoaL-like domain-containing protein [Dehalococcoidales bacterium]|nr:SnoaL-like domain-containing protein [Dehalococcoidales bacterium]